MRCVKWFPLHNFRTQLFIFTYFNILYGQKQIIIVLTRRLLRVFQDLLRKDFINACQLCAVWRMHVFNRACSVCLCLSAPCTRCTCVKQTSTHTHTHPPLPLLLCANRALSQVSLMHGPCDTERQGAWGSSGSSLNVAPGKFASSERMLHRLSTAMRTSEVQRNAMLATPYKRNGPLSVWLGPTPSISPVHLPQLRIKLARCNTSELMTCRQDSCLNVRVYFMLTIC